MTTSRSLFTSKTGKWDTSQKYNVVLADPPWSFKNKHTGGSMVSGSLAHYDVMSIDDICRLPVGDLAADNCMLFMWWVASQPLEALAVVEAWGFTLKTMTGFTWVKKTKHNKEWFGMGFSTRQGAENCLVATRGKPKRVNASVRAVTYARGMRHSQKPHIIRDKIVELMGDVPRVELFARDNICGWHAWGNEVQSDIEVKQ